MWNTQLPYCLAIDGKEYPLNKNGSFDIVLDCLEIMNDDELPESVQTQLVVDILFGYNTPAPSEEAIEKIDWFLNGGKEKTVKQSKEQIDVTYTEAEKKPVVDLVKDFPLYISALNMLAGYDVRSPEKFTHWWTFLAFFRELKECYYTQVVDLRRKLNTEGYGRLTKDEKEFLQENQDEVGFSLFNDEELEFFEELGL